MMSSLNMWNPSLVSLPSAGEEDEIILNVECHYTQAKVDSCIFNLGDCAHIKMVKKTIMCMSLRSLWQELQLVPWNQL
ncbi:DNA (cytosine-5)-methyltransferase CMT2 [Camellia lanceoleosa]|uniref:DNA (Cytosine-5)-methyltransferase CMT2 n=1 Tax=Camellia lanceoleosa TaxID=1840588 RepID=A0ACC0I5Z0_9ERIC|nr:DNA (cytosine-5)-methyltransferase CMT2 [Camellia lanceoleosa]